MSGGLAQSSELSTPAQPNQRKENHVKLPEEFLKYKKDLTDIELHFLFTLASYLVMLLSCASERDEEGADRTIEAAMNFINTQPEHAARLIRATFEISANLSANGELH